jgi:hypothetical protein
MLRSPVFIPREPAQIALPNDGQVQPKAWRKKKRRNVGRRLDALQTNLSGDVKKLTAKSNEYRLRVCCLRVLFTLENDFGQRVCCQRS